MSGFITERDFAAAECEFPGIRRFYECMTRKPPTFLQLLWAYEQHMASANSEPARAETRSAR
jgi:hypothetical protein